MELEFVKGIMTAAAAFITVTGIILAVGLNKQYLGNIAAGFLLGSILLGAVTVSCSLVWLSSSTLTAPNDNAKNTAFIFLFFQFFTWYIPSMIVFSKMFYKAK